MKKPRDRREWMTRWILRCAQNDSDWAIWVKVAVQANVEGTAKVRGLVVPLQPVPPDQEIGEHGGVLEQFDVLEGAGDAEPGDAKAGLLRDVLILEKNLSRGRTVNPRNQIED